MLNWQLLRCHNLSSHTSAFTRHKKHTPSYLWVQGVKCRHLLSRRQRGEKMTDRSDKLFEAARLGDATAQWQLGLVYSLGDDGVELNDEQAAYWYRKAAEQSEPKGQELLGIRYKYGWGVKRDGAKAMHWFHRAAEQGNNVALIHIGEMYFAGKAVEQSDRQGAYWFRMAAELGDPDGQYELASLYLEGRGVWQDLEEAVKWYRLAADQGFVSAREVLEKLGADWE